MVAISKVIVNPSERDKYLNKFVDFFSEKVENCRIFIA